MSRVPSGQEEPQSHTYLLSHHSHHKDTHLHREDIGNETQATAVHEHCVKCGPGNKILWDIVAADVNHGGFGAVLPDHVLCLKEALVPRQLEVGVYSEVLDTLYNHLHSEVRMLQDGLSRI